MTTISSAGSWARLRLHQVLVSWLQQSLDQKMLQVMKTKMTPCSEPGNCSLSAARCLKDTLTKIQMFPRVLDSSKAVPASCTCVPRS